MERAMRIGVRQRFLADRPPASLPLLPNRSQLFPHRGRSAPFDSLSLKRYKEVERAMRIELT